MQRVISLIRITVNLVNANIIKCQLNPSGTDIRATTPANLLELQGISIPYGLERGATALEVIHCGGAGFNSTGLLEKHRLNPEDAIHPNRALTNFR